MFITLRDPWKDFERLRRDIERSVFAPAAAPRRGVERPPVELASTEEHLVATFLLPGIDPASLAVTLHDGVLRVVADRPAAVEPEGARILRRERAVGRFERALELPVAVEADRITASYRDGVLTVTLPKHASVRPRTIPISAN